MSQGLRIALACLLCLALGLVANWLLGGFDYRGSQPRPSTVVVRGRYSQPIQPA